MTRSNTNRLIWAMVISIVIMTGNSATCEAAKPSVPKKIAVLDRYLSKLDLKSRLHLPVSTKANVNSRSQVQSQDEIRNNQSRFKVLVTVDRTDRTYAEGELLQIFVTSEEPGFLYLLDLRSDGKGVLLLPNKFQQENRIEAKEKVQIPSEEDPFELVVGAPFGQETLLAIVSQTELLPEQFGVDSLVPCESDVKSFQTVDISKGVMPRLKSDPPSSEPGDEPDDESGDTPAWSEHRIGFTTVAKRTVEQQSRKQKRFGIFVGLGDQMSTDFTKLPSCSADAILMAMLMSKKCGLDGGIILLDKDVTLVNFRKAFEEIKKATQPGDEVIIYWSSHGDTIADVEGDEDDGFDEFLLTYDAHGNDATTFKNKVLLDDEFGRLIQDMDGRRIVVIIDACFGAGLSETKGARNRKNLDFFGSEIQANNELHAVVRTKDIRQEDAILLSAAGSDETAMVLPSGKLSLMTCCLLAEIVKDESNQLTLEEAYTKLDKTVRKFLSNPGINHKQTTTLIRSPQEKPFILTRSE